MSKGKYVYVPRLTLVTPVSSGYFKVHKDCWWLVKDDNLVFYEDLRYPQCNASKAMAQHLGKRLDPGWLIEQIPFVYTPLNLKDFM